MHLAWHHFKRGGMTFLSAMMDGPSHAAVKIRADQTVTDSSKYYIMQSTGQDGFIGRLLSMLPYGEQHFAQQEYTLPSTTVIPWIQLVPDYEMLPQAFKYEVLPKLFATVVKHQHWLRTTLAPSHPLLSSELFTIHDALVRGASPYVHEQQRAMGQCTGLPLSLQSHLILRSSTLSAPQGLHAPAPLWLHDVAAPKPTDTSMRALYPLPRGYVLPKVTIAQCWRAWWSDTPASPMPLKFVAGKLKCAAVKVRYTRYKKVVKFIQSGLTADVCENNIALAFTRGWASLELHLRLQHQVSIDADAAPSSLYETVMKLGDAFKPPLLTTLHAAHSGAPRPMSEVLQDHLNVLAGAEACAGASAARQSVLVSQLQSALQPHKRRKRPAADTPPPAPPTAPAIDQSFKCCCGLVLQTLTSLKRHHDGAEGKHPREPAHPCMAGCTFPSRARK
jgi:hypothetical protein